MNYQELYFDKNFDVISDNMSARKIKYDLKYKVDVIEHLYFIVVDFDVMIPLLNSDYKISKFQDSVARIINARGCEEIDLYSQYLKTAGISVI